MENMSTTNRKKTYSLIAKFNGETYRKRTNDLNEAILALKPDWLHTEVFMTVKKGKVESERYLNMKQAKRVFNDDMTREIFINNLYLV